MNARMLRMGMLALMALCTMTAAVQAASYTWDGGASGDWDDSGEWDPTGYPTCSDDASFIDEGAVTVTLTGTEEVNDMLVDNSQVTISSTYYTLGVCGKLTITDGTLQASGSFARVVVY